VLRKNRESKQNLLKEAYSLGYMAVMYPDEASRLYKRLKEQLTWVREKDVRLADGMSKEALRGKRDATRVTSEAFERAQKARRWEEAILRAGRDPSRRRRKKALTRKRSKKTVRKLTPKRSRFVKSPSRKRRTARDEPLLKNAIYINRYATRTPSRPDEEKEIFTIRWYERGAWRGKRFNYRSFPHRHRSLEDTVIDKAYLLWYELRYKADGIDREMIFHGRRLGGERLPPIPHRYRPQDER
jgi:hypothetical protein